jgi:hypothetical protein
MTKPGLYTRLIDGYDLKIQRKVEGEWIVLGWNAEAVGYLELEVGRTYSEAKRIAESHAATPHEYLSRKPNGSRHAAAPFNPQDRSRRRMARRPRSSSEMGDEFGSDIGFGEIPAFPIQADY